MATALATNETSNDTKITADTRRSTRRKFKSSMTSPLTNGEQSNESLLKKSETPKPKVTKQLAAPQKIYPVRRVLSKGWHIHAGSKGLQEWCYEVEWRADEETGTEEGYTDWQPAAQFAEDMPDVVREFEAAMRRLDLNGPPVITRDTEEF